MSVEHIGKGYVKICVSEEELENSIAGLSQLKPILQTQVIKGNGRNTKQGLIDAAEMKNVITGITDVFKNIGSTFAGFGKNMVEGIWNGINGATQWIKDKISGWVGNVTDFLKDLFGIASPSKLMRDEIGVYLAQGIGVGFSNEIGGVKKMIEDSVPQEFDVDAKVNVGNEFKHDNDDKSLS